MQFFLRSPKYTYTSKYINESIFIYIYLIIVNPEDYYISNNYSPSLILPNQFLFLKINIPMGENAPQPSPLRREVAIFFWVWGGVGG